ncbi:MAG: hypothetical protein IPP94_01750 [Ignavibacteria bacterium]|nr:hypothetical protein [Ignavibacteria bacterium]
MQREDVPEYISALVDKEVTDLSDDEVELLQRMVHERPEYFGEYQITIATKLCLHNHLKSVRCPAGLADTIKSTLHHMFKSKQASL